jgi:hypothetical protein
MALPMSLGDSDDYRARADDLRSKATALRRMIGLFGTGSQLELAALATTYDAQATTCDVLAAQAARAERAQGRR